MKADINGKCPYHLNIVLQVSASSFTSAKKANPENGGNCPRCEEEHALKMEKMRLDLAQARINDGPSTHPPPPSSGGGGAGQVFPRKLVAFVERADLSAETTDAVLGHLCNNLGATEVSDLNGLEEEDQEALLKLVPKLKKKAFQTLLTEAASGGGSQKGAEAKKVAAAEKEEECIAKEEVRCKTYADGATYVGAFNEAGQIEGQGTYTWASGAKYVGAWKAGKQEGQGTYTFADGAKYVGAWKAGKQEGQGTYTFADGAKYVGAWKAGKQEGQGTYTFADGAKYVGAWKAGLKEGEGTFTFANGDKYVGAWKAGLKEGQGTYTYASGTVYHAGKWKADNPV